MRIDPIRKIKGNYAWLHSTVLLTLSLRVFKTALGFVFWFKALLTKF